MSETSAPAVLANEQKAKKSSSVASDGECIENFRCTRAFRNRYVDMATETDKSKSRYIRDALEFYEVFAIQSEEMIQAIKIHYRNIFVLQKKG